MIGIDGHWFFIRMECSMPFKRRKIGFISINDMVFLIYELYDFYRPGIGISGRDRLPNPAKSILFTFQVSFKRIV